jgi:hypothetical protein
MASRVFSIGLVVALVGGLLVRLAIIFSPLGQIDGDEAVVGLMARHIAFLGERPVFYWGQPYLGSLEAFSAAPLFRLFDSSTLLLKLVPTVYSLGFLAVNAVMARRLFGIGPGLATAAYLALPPAMWAVWSTKARGGYAELLFLGQCLLLVTLLLAPRRDRKLALLCGLLAGLTIWTHLLGVVYLAAAGVYLALGRRANWAPIELGLVAGGGVLGMLPLLVENLTNGFPTVEALVQPPDFTIDIGAQLVRFFRVGVPVLLGLGQPTTSEVMFDADWLLRPAHLLPVAALAMLVLLAVVISFVPSLRKLIRYGADRFAEPAILVLLALIVPAVVALTRFGFLVAEPRYALPLYGTVPLMAGALWRVPFSRRFAAFGRWTVVGLVLAFNTWSVLSTDARLWLPEAMSDSTESTRAALVSQLVSQDRHQMYTDYWIGYPVMFETRETVLAYVIAGGFNRYVPPADNVQRTPNPAWVFIPHTEAEQEFLNQLSEVGGRANANDVSVYRVYTDVEPLTSMRPPGLISSPPAGMPP